MSATYIIDGYNLLHAMGVLCGRVGPGGLEKARLRLLGLLHGTFAEQTPTVTVVFDASGAPRGASAEARYRGLHIRFALGGQEADDEIERLLQEASAPKSVHVVSDDRRVQQSARRRQATVLKCEEFLLQLDRFRRQQQSPTSQPPEKQEKLSAEEMQGWLEEFGDVERDPSLRQAFEKFEFEED
jgi:predicted RNA-binding protein with PIN domain